MTLRNKLKQSIGENIYSELEKEADKEVRLALKMPLQSPDGHDRYYEAKSLALRLLPKYELFQKNDLSITPIDVVNVLFRCKMLFAVQSEDEYCQRVGGDSPYDEGNLLALWAERKRSLEDLTDNYLDRLKDSQSERTLIVEINSYKGDSSKIQRFFDELFEKLDYSFTAYIDENTLAGKHKALEPKLRNLTQNNSKEYFCSPSIGFTVNGSLNYCELYSSA